MDGEPRVEIAGLRLAAITQQQLIERVFAALCDGHGGWVITANVDHLRRFVREPELRANFAAADLVVADGMPLLWASRLRGTPLPERVAGADLVWRLAERAAAEGRSLYLLGGNPGAAEAAARLLREHWPALHIAGVSSPLVSSQPTPAELAEIRATLTAARPDLVYVGLGAPKQEHLIAALRAGFPATWFVGVGISLSFLAGEVTRAPRWIQALGLEWAHRLVQEPRRLARRYLVDDLPFTLGLLARSWGQRVRRLGTGE